MSAVFKKSSFQRLLAANDQNNRITVNSVPSYYRDNYREGLNAETGQFPLPVEIFSEADNVIIADTALLRNDQSIGNKPDVLDLLRTTEAKSRTLVEKNPCITYKASLDNPDKRLYLSPQIDRLELSRKTAIHEAGHAAAIYFGNKQKQLPPVFFQIILSDGSCNTYNNNGQIKVEGGRLIHTLPSSFEENCGRFSSHQKQTYQQAFEADIINLLVGPLAEANYVAQCDNELISPRLVPLNALHNYGGAADLEIIHDYLQCFSKDRKEQEEKITKLFWQAFDFINDWTHWNAITALANYVLIHDKDIIDYEEVVSVLEAHYCIARRRA
jgi:hypothetical protein